MRATGNSPENSKGQIGSNDLFACSSCPERSPHKMLPVHSPEDINGTISNDDLMRLTQENQFLRTKLEQSKVLLRNITNAAKVNSSQLELMKVYKEQHDSMSKRLAEVEEAYLIDAKRLQQLLVDNQILQRQTEELTLINNAYCKALTEDKSMRSEMVEACTKAVAIDPALAISTDSIELEKDIKKQLLASIESGLVHRIAKHDLSHMNVKRELSKRPKSTANNISNNSQIQLARTKLKSRSNSYNTHKRKETGKVTRTASSGSKRAHSTRTGAVTITKVNLDQFTKPLFKETDLLDNTCRQESSLSELPCKNLSHPSSEFNVSKVPDNSFTTTTVRNISISESEREIPSVSTEATQVCQSTSITNSIQAKQSSTPASAPKEHDIYKDIAISDLRSADASLNTSVSTERIASNNHREHQDAPTSGRVSEFYKQHIRTVTEPLLQSIANLERDNETLQVVLESKDKEITILKNMLAELYVKPGDIPSKSAARTVLGTSSILSSSTEHTNHMLNDSTSYSYTDRGLKSAESTASCTGSGLHMSNNKLPHKDTYVSKVSPGLTLPYKVYKAASSGDYAILEDIEKVRNILQDVGKIRHRMTSDTSTMRSDKHVH